MFGFLESFSKWITYGVLSIPHDSLMGKALEFFIFDVIKIFFLLFALIFSVAIVRSYLPIEKIHRYLARKNKYWAHLLASLLGIITPFCTCSAIPLFLSFIEVGIPTGVTFSFLIASPMINEVALVMLLGLFGIKIALIYAIFGLLISFWGGLILGKIGVDRWIKKDILIQDFSSSNAKCCDGKKNQRRTKIHYARKYTWSIFKKVWVYIVIGVGLGAWIHGYVPANFLANYADGSKWYDVPVAIALGVPLYSNAAGVIPLVSSLTEKGVSIGTALAFLMAVSGLSLPEFLILKRIMNFKLLGLFVLIVTIGIIIAGYFFNWILGFI